MNLQSYFLQNRAFKREREREHFRVVVSIEMSYTLRLCQPIDFPFLLSYVGGTRFAGFFSSYLTDFLTHFTRNSNLTLEVQENRGLGSRINSSTDMYDGCLGMIQRNDSDILMMFADYPLEVVDVTQGDLFTDSVIQFISFSQLTKEQSVGQMLSCFQSLSLNLWLLIGVTITVVYSLMKLRTICLTRFFRRRCSRRRNHYYLYHILAHITRLGKIKDGGCFNKLLFLSLSIPSLVLIHYICMMIKADLVIEKEPDIYKSYDDLITNQVTLSFYRGNEHEKYFKFAPDGSKEKILWQQTLSKFNEDETLFRAGDEVQKLFDRARRIITRKEVIITDNTLSPMYRVFMCQLLFDSSAFDRVFKSLGLNIKAESSSFLFGQDEGAYRSQKGLILRKSFTGPIRRRLKSIFELGVAGQTIYEGGHQDISDQLAITRPKDAKKLQDLRSCIEGSKQQKKETFGTLDIENIRSFTLVVIFAFCAWVISLYFEHSLKRSSVTRGRSKFFAPVTKGNQQKKFLPQVNSSHLTR